MRASLAARSLSVGIVWEIGGVTPHCLADGVAMLVFNALIEAMKDMQMRCQIEGVRKQCWRREGKERKI